MALLLGIKKLFGPLIDDLGFQLAAAFIPDSWLQKRDLHRDSAVKGTVA
jgi:hypothetical protein